MHHTEPDCLAKRLFYPQGQGHSEGSYSTNMIVSTISSELVSLFSATLVESFCFVISLAYSSP